MSLPSEVIVKIVNALEMGEDAHILAERLDVDESDVLKVKARLDVLELESNREAVDKMRRERERRARHGTVKVVVDTNPFLMRHRAMPTPRRRPLVNGGRQ